MVVEEVTLEQRPKGNEGTSHSDILKREGLCQQVQAEIFECPKNTQEIIMAQISWAAGRAEGDEVRVVRVHNIHSFEGHHKTGICSMVIETIWGSWTKEWQNQFYILLKYYCLTFYSKSILL